VRLLSQIFVPVVVPNLVPGDYEARPSDKEWNSAAKHGK